METDIAAILEHHIRDATKMADQPTPDIAKLTAFYQSRMLAHGYDKREPEAHRAIALWCARRWAGVQDRGLLLYGDNGNGKTLGAQLIARFFGTKSLWAPDVVRYWLKDEDVPWLERCQPVPGLSDRPRPNLDLIIDEIGKDLETGQTVTDRNGNRYPEIALPVKFGHRFNPLQNLLALRYDQWRASGKTALTIVTTNLDDSGIERYYGKHIRDRFNEMFQRVAFIGPSRRAEWRQATAF